MSKGSSTSRQTSHSSGSSESSSQQSSRPSTPNELLSYFSALDALTRPDSDRLAALAAMAPKTTTTTKTVPVARQPTSRVSQPEQWSYKGQIFSSRSEAENARRNDFDSHTYARGVGSTGSYRPPVKRVGGSSLLQTVPQTKEVTETTTQPGDSTAALTSGNPGRLFQWAQSGSAPIAYDASDIPTVSYTGVVPTVGVSYYGGSARYDADNIRDVVYDASGISDVDYNELTEAQLRALGGAGETRALAARRLWEDQLARTAADPRLSIYQSSYQNLLNDREYQANQDAIAAEVEALLTQVAQEERAQDLAAQTTNQDAARDIALRRMQADTTNQEADLTSAQAMLDARIANQNAEVQLARARSEAQQANQLAALKEAELQLQADLANQSIASQNAFRQLGVNQYNSELTAQDLSTLSDLFFGGKGQYSQGSSQSRSRNSSYGSGNNRGANPFMSGFGDALGGAAAGAVMGGPLGAVGGAFGGFFK